MRLTELVKSYRVSGANILTEFFGGIIGVQAQTRIVTPTYGVTVGIDASLGDNFIITATNGVAFTVNAPTNVPLSTYTKHLTITIANGSGGVLGAITWTAGAGGFRLAGAFTNPANATQRSVIFRWNGTVWHELARTAADVTTA